MAKLTGLVVLSLTLSALSSGQAAAPVSKPRSSPPAIKVCPRCIRANMEFLASDAMNGRGSASHDELVAATYVASQLRAYGIEPAGDNGGYLQQAVVLQQKLTGSPQIVATESGKSPVTLAYGQQFLSVYLTQTQFQGGLQKLSVQDAAQSAKPGAVVLITGTGNARQAAFAANAAGAAGALIMTRDSTAPPFAQAGPTAP